MVTVCGDGSSMTPTSCNYNAHMGFIVPGFANSATSLEYISYLRINVNVKGDQKVPLMYS